MAAQLPVVFRSGSGDARFSFSWFDFATGAGYKTFQCVGGNSSGGATYFMSAGDMDSDGNNMSINTSGTTLTFDITFNNPVTIAAADAFINWTDYLPGASKTSSIVFTVYHVDLAASATSLGTATSDTRTSGGTASTSHRLLKAALTKKSFGIGEKLRVTVAWTHNDSSNSQLYYDSMGTTVSESGTGRTVPKSMTVDIPFVVDI